MSLYRIAANKLEPVSRTTFSGEKLKERKDLQRLLHQDISLIGDDLMVIAEEYGEWEDSKRRIDLLCLSKDAALVVIEIKRTEDGGHMELQAIRYAAMVSSMSLEQVIQAYAQEHGVETEAARNEVLDFLQRDPDGEEVELTGEVVRIILVSADFSTELTTSVLWLNRHDLDITCIRLRPYRLGNEIIVDATQIIPLPETTDYEVKMRVKEKEQKKAVSIRAETLRRFWGQLIERSRLKTPLLANRTKSDAHWLSAGIGCAGFSLNMSLVQHDGQVECYIRLPGGEAKNSIAFNALLKRKDEIELKFGEALDWQELPGRIGCRICKKLSGGWRSPESEWVGIQDRMIDTLIRLDAALRNPIQQLKV